MSGLLVEVNNAVLGYREGGAMKSVLNGISLSISLGDFIVLEGVNGSGKTTLIRSLLGLLPVISGSIDWKIDRSLIGYVPQEATMDPDIPATAIDIVKTASPLNWLRSDANGMEMLERVGLKEKAKTLFGSLSGGQKRRALLAKALAGAPSILILDEPTVNVDTSTENAMESLLHELCNKGTVGVLAVTHALSWAKQARRYRIISGRLHG